MENNRTRPRILAPEGFWRLFGGCLEAICEPAAFQKRAPPPARRAPPHSPRPPRGEGPATPAETDRPHPRTILECWAPFGPLCRGTDRSLYLLGS